MEHPRLDDQSRKRVTVLFADIKGSTELGEQLDPERLYLVLSTYFSAMSAAIEAWGGTVEKYVGDAILAVFGIPLVREDDAERALRAGFDMLQRLDHLNRELADRHKTTLEVRIAVDTGEVVAPAGGAPGRGLVLGDPANVAARLQGEAEPGTILAGQRTYLAARHAFRFDQPTPLVLRGKREPVAAYPVVGPLAKVTRGVPGLRSVMVGRDRQLGELLRLLDEVAQTRQARLVLMVGEAGIGKSRLLTEFLRLAAARYSQGAVLQGRCPSAGAGITYWPLAEMLRRECGIDLEVGAEVAERKLRAGAGRALAPLGLPAAEVDRTIFALAATAGITLPDSPLDRMEPQEVAEEVARAWPRFLRAQTAGGPAVVAVEDLHWGSAELLGLLDRVATSDAGPLLVVTTARPELGDVHPGFPQAEDAARISVPPLNEAERTDLLDGLLSSAGLPFELCAQILSRTEGNPFFLEEILRRLIDEGVLVRAGDRWQVIEAAVLTPLPETVHGVLAARIDALPPLQQTVLQEAAVVGRVFWEGPVARSVGQGDVKPALLELERRGLVSVRPTSSVAGQVEYLFAHALVRDVAYATLTKARRARAHADVGGWLEDLAADRAQELAELLAHHFGLAATGEGADLAWGDDPSARETVRRKAFEHSLRAGAVTRRHFALQRALELHQQALTLAATEHERGQALEELGDDHFDAFHGDDAVARYQEVLDLARGDPSRDEDRARLCRKMVRTMARWGGFRTRPDPAVVDELIREGLESTRDEQTRAWLLTLSGISAKLWDTGPIPLEDRIRSVEMAWSIAGRLDLPVLSALTTEILSELYYLQGSFSLALEASRHELEFVERIDSPSHRADAFRAVAGMTMTVAGDPEEGLELARRSYRLAREGSAHGLMHATCELIRATYRLGRWSELSRFLEEHLAALQHEPETNCRFARGGSMEGAIALLHMGESERARDVAARVRPSPEDPYVAGLRAEFAVASGDPSRGRGMAEAALREAQRWRHVDPPGASLVRALLEALVALADWEQLKALATTTGRQRDAEATLGPAFDRAEGLAHAAAGRMEEAAALLTRALEAFDRMKVPFEAARTREGLASMVGPDDGRRLRLEAIQVYERLGARPHAERVRAILG
jgi:predicted ATPase/class 3 adenylate cyclase